MPTISVFYGITIQMYWREHAPAHFHAYYQGFEAMFSIETGELVEGSMSPGPRRIIKAWSLKHQQELQVNWQRSKNSQPFDAIRGADEE